MLTVITSRKHLVLAIVLGAVLQVLLLAFGLHVDLWIARITGGCVRCNWAVVAMEPKIPHAVTRHVGSMGFHGGFLGGGENS